MRILVTAGPTREYLDPVRFLSNASSGRMGYAIAASALAAGHDVTLLSGPVALAPPDGCEVIRFVSVSDLHARLAERFGDCDALVMTAAVGDFRPERTLPAKIPRAGGPVTVRLFPTEDVLSAVTADRRQSQRVIAFAVEDGPEDGRIEKARREMATKRADWTVVNTPEAMDADESLACVIDAEKVVLPWARRTKQQLADTLVGLLAGRNEPMVEA